MNHPEKCIEKAFGSGHVNFHFEEIENLFRARSLEIHEKRNVERVKRVSLNYKKL
jgi:hypothetical protein